MGRNLDLEALREVFKDKRTHIAVAKILKLSVAQDRSFLKLLVSILPEQREVIARMTWPMTGPSSGIIEFPEKDDLVLVAFADGNDDYCFVVSRMTSKVDKLPLKAIDGHMVFKAKSGKQVWITSNNKILLSQGDSLPTENLVLGQELKNLLIDILTELSDLSQKVATHNHIGNLGYPVSTPVQSGDFITISSNFDDLKASPVQDETILSDVSFTEKGS